MDDKAMTNEENYRFDVAGYMIVPGVLTVAELLFLGSAQAHGAYPWTGEQNRRMIFFQYRSRSVYAP